MALLRAVGGAAELELATAGPRLVNGQPREAERLREGDIGSERIVLVGGSTRRPGPRLAFGQLPAAMEMEECLRDQGIGLRYFVW